MLINKLLINKTILTPKTKENSSSVQVVKVLHKLNRRVNNKWIWCQNKPSNSYNKLYMNLKLEIIINNWLDLKNDFHLYNILMDILYQQCKYFHLHNNNLHKLNIFQYYHILHNWLDILYIQLQLMDNNLLDKHNNHQCVNHKNSHLKYILYRHYLLNDILHGKLYSEYYQYKYHNQLNKLYKIQYLYQFYKIQYHKLNNEQHQYKQHNQLNKLYMIFYQQI